MLRLVLKKDESLKIGDDIIIKSMTDGRVSLAIDAPREVKIERLEAEILKVEKAQEVTEGKVYNMENKKIMVNHKKEIV